MTLSTVRYLEQDMGYETPCWVWQRQMTHDGYGVESIRASDGSRLAHRYYWERENGPVPEGLELDHLCRNHACVRPSHLEPVTHTENMRRGLTTKLSEDDVFDIRKRVARGDLQQWVADAYGITQSQVSNIVLWKSWTV